MSDYARSLAVDLLTKSAKLTAYSIAPESVEQFEHDLLLRWNFDNRGMILTCPAAEGAGPSLYRETIKGNKSETVELKQNINAEQLAEAMEWLFDR